MEPGHVEPGIVEPGVQTAECNETFARILIPFQTIRLASGVADNPIAVSTHRIRHSPMHSVSTGVAESPDEQP
jgi:hypothetical protein